MSGIDVREAGPRTVAFVSMHGPYAQVPEAFGRLYKWIEAHRLQPTGEPEAVYLSAPGEVPESDAAWELRAPVIGDVVPSGPDEHGLGVKRLPAETVATVVHKGPYDTVEPTYRELQRWIAEHGYEIVGPPQEAYLNGPEDTPENEYLTEVRFPVRPRAE